MKAVKSGISVLLAVIMLFSVIPTSIVYNVAAADPDDDTDINIPISLDGVSQTRGEAMATDTLSYSKTGKVEWKHPSSTGKLKELLESKKEADKYISLTKDLSEKWRHDPMETYSITSDKVLDLNGHEIHYHVDSIVRPWSKWGIEQSPYQREDKEHLMNTAMEIKEGATFTIIDSSMKKSINGNEGTGLIEINGYMVDPYKHDYNNYPNFDLFNVSDGNLVIYGGKFISGRSKAQFKSNWSWSKFKTVVGQAVELGTNIAAYATGIDAAVASKDDLLEGFKKLAADDDTKSDSTKKEKDEKTTKNPDGGQELKTVGEKQDGIDNPKPDADGNTPEKAKNNSENGENKANDNKSAKSDKNTKIAEANKKIVDSVINKDGIKGMVDSAFALAEGIGGLIGDDQKSRVIQNQFGTTVKVGNKGTFVSYGGEHIGYGSSPNTRNAVVEVTRAVGGTKDEKTGKYKGGQAYIYGGNFTARAGANVFNIVTNNSGKKVTQTRQDENGNRTEETIILGEPETMGLEELKYESNGITPIDTSNIMVRGGTFKTFYELRNVGIKTSDDNHFSTFIGTSGSVNLGITSFNEDFIKDGRIQINDMYGDGALVLMDENRDDNDVYHYRLFCSDMELRYKQGLSVYPNTAKTNTTNSFALKTQLNGGDTQGLEQVFKDDNENVRGAYSTTEKLFYFPINSESTDGYTIKPTFKNLDPDATNMSASETWYYADPVDTEGKIIPSLVLTDSVIQGTPKSSVINDFKQNDPKALNNNFNSTLNTYTTTFGGQTYVDTRTVSDTNEKNLKKVFDNYTTFSNTYNYQSNLKWFEYKVYRVDPLTRLNVGKDGKIGDDQPIAVGAYGSKAKKGLKTMIRLTDLENKIKAQNSSWGGYKQGEMYRITLSVEERLNYNYQGYDKYAKNTTVNDSDEYAYTTSVGTSKATSSIVFMCYGEEERTVKEGYSGRTQDFTPLQWTDEPAIGKKLSVDFVNAKTGNVDFETTRIFDIYYQWWTVDEDGKKKDLLAGTTNVWDIAKRYKEAKENNLNEANMRAYLNKDKEYHTYSNWLRGKDNFKYANILAPDDPIRNEKDRNGNALVFDENDLPKIEYTSDGQVKTGTNKWPKNVDAASKLIHAYSHQWMSPDGLKENKNYNLSNKNNNLDYGNSDSLYIPKSLAGERIMVEAIAVNVNWTDYYDAVQTFYSHTIQLPMREFEKPVSCYIDVTYDNNFISVDNEATLSAKGVYGLDDDEYVRYAAYEVYSDDKLVGLKSFELNPGDAIPTVKYPTDFYKDKVLEKGKRYAGISPKELEFKLYVVTNVNSIDYDRRGYSDGVKAKYEVEAENYKMNKPSYTFDLEEIKSGKVTDGQIKLITVFPINYSIGAYFDTAQSTNKDVAYIDENGMLAFGGSAGTATLSIKDPAGNTVSTDVEVIDYVDDVDISNINPPEIGKQFKTNVKIPDGVDYKVKEVYWTDGAGNRMAEADVAKNYRVYTINIVVEKAAPSLVFRNAETDSYLNYHPFTLHLTNVEGENETVTNKLENGKFDYVLNPLTNEYEVGDTCTYSYTYKTSVGEADTTINRISLDFPTEVREGDSVDAWMEQFNASTNGDDTEFKFYPGFVMTSYAEQTLKAYGYKLNGTEPADEMKAFIKGTIDGPMMKIDLVWKDTVSFAAKDQINILINGETNENATLDVTSSTTATVTVPNALTVLDGTTIPVLPKYTVKKFSMAVDETVKLDDMLDTDGEVKLVADLAKMNDIADYVEYDDAKNTLTGLKATEQDIVLPLYVTVDGNGDGVVDMRVNEKQSVKVYASASDCPAPDSGVDINISVKTLKPDGTAAYEKTVKAHKASTTSTSAVFSISEVDDAIVTKIERERSGKFRYDLSGGLDRISANLEDGDSITVYTQSENDIVVNTSESELYPQFAELDDLCVSLDGDHWTTSKLALTGLTPDTEYLLYYKQGPTGSIHTKVVKTQPKDTGLGLYIGRMPVTKTEPGNLEKDGYHYDVDTKTLTLKDFTIKDMGVDVSTAKLFNQFNIRSQSVIFAKDDLTIELIGENRIEKTDGESNFIVENVINAKGDITFTGSGNLTLIGTGLTQAVEPAKDSSIYLKGTGKITFEDTAVGLYTTGTGKVRYTNGELDYNGNKDLFDGTYITGNLVMSNEVFVSSTAEHPYKLYAGKDDTVEVTHVYLDSNNKEEYKKIQDNIDLHDGQSIVHLVPQHSFTQKVESDKYYVSGSCETGVTYYMSCSCGAADHDNTFTAEPHDHELISHKGLPATCIEDGYKDYHTCAKCKYTDFEVIHAAGHSYVHHDEVLPTCENDGCPAYDECSVCGYSSLDKKIQISLDKNKNDKSPSGSSVQPSGDSADDTKIVRDDLWIAKGHDLISVPEVANTCTENGVRSHFKCTHCEKLFEDESGMVETTADDLVIEADHEWGMWAVTKQPTEQETGVETRVCQRDPSHTETRTIPVLGHVHHLTLVPAKEATYTEEGNLAYYTCDGCDYWFEDAEGTKIIDSKSSFIIPAKQKPTESTVTEPTVTTPTESTATEPTITIPTAPTVTDPTVTTPTEPTATEPTTPAVKPTEPVKVTPKLSKTSLTLKSGKTATLKVSGGKASKFTSSNAKVATVTKAGKVTALKKGSVKITVKLTDGTKLVCKVKVSTSPSITIGGKKFNTKTTYSFAKKKGLTVKITGKATSIGNKYATSNKKVAKVTSKATATTVKITGYKKGKTTITLKVNGVAFKIKVNVK